jgi:two-component system, LuxR family, sensor kinase FixL
MPIDGQVLQTVYDTSPDAIIVVDEKARVCSFNKMAEKLFDYSAKEVLGQNIKMLMPAYFAHQHDGYMELAIGESKTRESRFFAGFIRDLTELQNYEQRVQEFQQELIALAANMPGSGEQEAKPE